MGFSHREKRRAERALPRTPFNYHCRAACRTPCRVVTAKIITQNRKIAGHREQGAHFFLAPRSPHRHVPSPQSPSPSAGWLVAHRPSLDLLGLEEGREVEVRGRELRALDLEARLLQGRADA